MKNRRFAVLFATFLALTTALPSFGQLPELNLPNNELTLGVREVIPSVQQFCLAFQEAMNEELRKSGQNVQVKYVSIENEYAGQTYSRFQGVIDGSITAECGPNSTSARDLTTSDGQRYSDLVAFSDSFYETEIQLLLKWELAEELRALSGADLRRRLAALKIGTLEGTTTEAAFSSADDLYQNVSIIKANVPDPGNPIVGEGSLEIALNALEAGDIEAFASDGIILKTFLEDGVTGNNEDRPDEVIYRKSRGPYRDRGFTVFPAGSASLPDLPKQLYGIAIKRGENSGAIKSAIDLVLDSAYSPGTVLKQASSRLYAYERGDTVEPNDDPGNSDAEDTDSSSNLFPIIGVGIALAALATAGVWFAKNRPTHTVQGPTTLSSYVPPSPPSSSFSGSEPQDSTSYSDSSATAAELLTTRKGAKIEKFRKRSEIFRTLSNLPAAQFGEVVFGLEVPPGNIPSNVSRGEQVNALLRWATSSIGCGLEHIEEVLQAVIDSSR